MRTRFISLALVSLAIAGRTQDVQEAEKAGLPLAEEDVARGLLETFAAAREAQDAVEVTAALEAMHGYANPEFRAPALEGLEYGASSVDRKRVQEEAQTFGITSKDENAERLSDLETGARIAGARLLGNIPGKESEGPLFKTLKQKDVREDRPQLAAAVIDALGRLGYDKATKDVHKIFRDFSDVHTVPAAVRFFGQTKCKDKDIVMELCRQLEPPRQTSGSQLLTGAFATGGQNERYKIWDASRKNLVWTLEQVTGQRWRADDSGDDEDDDEGPSEAERALEFVKENARELGLK